MSPCTVEILLPTYNGSRFISGLLESLCNQTFSDFALITRDDGSSDDTITRMEEFSSRLNIRRIGNADRINLGVIKSFEVLIAHSSAELIFFCDQDDLWNSNKVSRMVELYLGKKSRYGDKIPLLLFSDLSLIDENDIPDGASFLSVNNFNTAALGDPYYLSFKNPAPGCSIAANRELLSGATPFPEVVFMHDWWMIIDAALRGRIEFLDEQLVRYRIHATNTLGITPEKRRSIPALFSNWLHPGRLSRILSQHKNSIAQGKAVFRKNNRRFSVPWYIVKAFLGRLIMPRIVRMTGKGKQYSWAAPTE
jgi:rhamnosyltransferase